MHKLSKTLALIMTAALIVFMIGCDLLDKQDFVTSFKEEGVIVIVPLPPSTRANLSDNSS